MEIVNIFEVVKDKLYTVKWDDKEEDEFISLFGDEEKENIGEWQDVEFLKDFFVQFGSDLRSGFFDVTKTKDAVNKTIAEAEIFKKRFIQLAKNEENLDDLFQPLTKNAELYEYEVQKAYGPEYKSWLRIYAIKLADNVYVVTGGAIKLTASMNTRPHLKKEL